VNAQEIELAEPGRTGLDDVWWLLRRPAALVGISYPTPETGWEALSEAGVGVILQLEPGEYGGLPLKRLQPAYVEDLVHGAIERRRSKLESSWQTRVVEAWPDPPERTSAI